jgi:hypothetical protein
MQIREALEEKMKAATAVLDSNLLSGEPFDDLSSPAKATLRGLPQAVRTAVNILKS